MKPTYLTGCRTPLLAVLCHFSQWVAGQSARHDLQNPAELSGVFDTVVSKRMERYHIPGVALAVVKDGKLHWSKGYGYADLETKTPVEADKTIFRIGSITKVFTATAVMQLVDEGKVNLDEEINKFLNDKLAYRNGVPVTLHHLLPHSEGFREIPGRRTSSADKILPLRVFLKDRLVQDHYAGELGTYGTYGMALSGLLVENISGMPYRDYLQKKLFAPLQMTHTNATDIPEENKKFFATGYDYSGEEYKKMAFEYYHTFPASDVNSTATDMASFMLMLLNDGRYRDKRILSPHSATQMKTTQFRNDPRLVGYTNGLFESTINGTKAVYHGGVMDGYASLMYLWPEKNLGLFMVCNREEHAFLNSLLNNFLYYFFPAPAAPVDRPDPSLKTNMAKFAGNFQRPGAPKIDITVNGDSTLSFWGGRWLQVEPLLFRVTNGTLDTGEDLIAFKENKKGEIVWMTTGPFVYFRLQKPSSTDKTPLSFTEKELESFTGIYTVSSSIAFTISRQKDKLAVKVNDGPPSELIATSKNSFFSPENNATIRFLAKTTAIEVNGDTLMCTKKPKAQ